MRFGPLRLTDGRTSCALLYPIDTDTDTDTINNILNDYEKLILVRWVSWVARYHSVLVLCEISATGGGGGVLVLCTCG